MAKKKKTTDDESSASKRGRIKSDFPKHTLEQSLRVAKGLYSANGGQPLPPLETATAIGLSPGSSEFRTILSSSIKYGLTSGSFNSESISLEKVGLAIVEPRTTDERHQSLLKAALHSAKFKAIYEYYRGKKLPEPQFFENTVVREFDIPRDHAKTCVDVFLANVAFVGLVRETKNGRWLSTEAHQPPEVDEDGDEQLDDELAVDDGDHAEESANLHDVPNGGNAIFVGHGKNRKPMESLLKILDQYSIPYKVAIDEANRFRPISQKVADTMQECGAAILIFTADEKFIDSNGDEIWRPSENVVYELGAASVLYGGRIIIFKEDAVTFPTNFRDIGYIEFEKNSLAAKSNELFGELISFGLIKISVGT